MEDNSLYVSLWFHVEWKIKNFFDLPKEEFFRVNSPSFEYSMARWHFSIYPNGINNSDNAKYVSLSLCKEKSSPVRIVNFKMGIKKSDGSQVRISSFASAYKFSYEGEATFYEFIPRSILQRSRKTYVPDGTLTVFCDICLFENQQVPALSGVVLQPSLLDDYSILAEDFKEMYISKRCSDVTICVQDKEFLAHRFVLAARSPVFASMFQNEMAEKISGKVKIPDCDPSSFDEFLLFLYTGKFDNVPITKAVNLYKTAHKYGVKQLKEKCVYIMLRDLCVDSFCDVMHLATLYDESYLRKVATEFFIQNAETILMDTNWRQFSQENSAVSAELYMRFVASKQ